MTHEQKPESVKARRLTRDERRWIKGVQAALADNPPRSLGFYSTGDPNIAIYDFLREDLIDSISNQIDCFGNAVEKANAGTSLSFILPNAVHAVRG